VNFFSIYKRRMENGEGKI